MATTEELTARRALLQAALDRLLTGSQVERVNYDGREITYNQVDLDRLRAEIASIDAQLASDSGRYRATPIVF